MKIIKKSENIIKKQIKWYAENSTEVSPEEKQKILEDTTKISQIENLHILFQFSQESEDLIKKHKDKYLQFLRSKKHKEYGEEEVDKILNKLEIILWIKDGSRQAEEIKKFVANRLTTLKKKTKLNQGMISTFKRKQEDFILPDTEIKRSIFVDSLHINDPEIYDIIIKQFKQIYEKWNNNQTRNILMNAIIYALGEYFGNYYGTQYTEQENRKFYINQTDEIDLAALKEKNIAVCIEKAAVTHNFLKFFGVCSYLILSTKCKIGDWEDAHAYIIFQTTKGKFIFDPTNPVLIEDREGHVKHITPAIYKISDEEYEHIIQNDEIQVVIEHHDQILDKEKYTKMEAQKRIYG